jgi:hypothetical protein
MTDPNKIDEVKPSMPDISLQEKLLGKNVLHAPQQVTAPPAAPSWTTGTGAGGTYLTSANTTELTAIYNTILDIYNALLKEGLIKKK